MQNDILINKSLARLLVQLIEMYIEKQIFDAGFMVVMCRKTTNCVIHSSAVGHTSTQGPASVCDFWIPNVSLNFTIFTSCIACKTMSRVFLASN